MLPLFLQYLSQNLKENSHSVRQMKKIVIQKVKKLRNGKKIRKLRKCVLSVMKYIIYHKILAIGSDASAVQRTVDTAYETQCNTCGETEIKMKKLSSAKRGKLDDQ